MLILQEVVMRFPARLDFKLISISVAALVIVSVFAIDSILDLVELKELARTQMRDARQGALNADFDVALVRAAGEAASYVTTQNSAYLDEAKEAIERAETALNGLRSTLVNSASKQGLESKHSDFLKQQWRLFAQVRDAVRATQSLGPNADSAATPLILNQIYAYEREAELLRPQIIGHRDLEFSANEMAIRKRAQHTITDFLASLALFIFFMGGLVLFTRRAIVRPLDRLASTAAVVANGDFDQKVAPTGRDEIKRLQLAFNEMVDGLRRQHAALAESESRFRQMAEHFPGVFVMSEATSKEVLYVSPGYSTMWGQPIDSLYRQPESITQSIYPQDRERMLGELAKLDRGESYAQEYRIVRPDGAIRWIWERSFPINDAQGNNYRVTAVYEDITERKQIEEELRSSEQQLHAALAEREQVNRDLHDDVLQSIYAVGLTLEKAQRATQTNPALVRERVTNAIGQLNDIMRNIRLYILEPEARLRTKQDLMSALHSLIQTAQGNQAPVVSAEVDPRVMPALAEEHARNLLQIVREAISNAQRHAQARSIRVALKQFDGRPRLTISDDGCGFETRTPSCGGHGLRNMAARANLMGARLEILSELGRGTQIAVDLVLSA
jgi:PAS domain S-box-containing protein